MDLFSSCISIDTLSSVAFLVDAQGVPLPPGNEEPVAPQSPTDEWTENFARSLQSQHARIREFLRSRGDRWRQVAARFTGEIEKLQAEVRALTAANEALRAGSPAIAADGEPAGADGDASASFAMAMAEVRDLKARNADLQRQLVATQARPGKGGELAASDRGGDWETQKRRFLAELESDDRQDADSADRRLKIEEIVARTDKIIAEKDREIEELRHLLNNQSDSIGSLALGAAALEQVFDQDEIIRVERERLQQMQDELRETLRRAEIEHAMERARLARREVEVEERFRNSEARRAGTDAEGDALAPTGRPVRGRWRTQMGLNDDEPPEFDRGRR